MEDLDIKFLETLITAISVSLDYSKCIFDTKYWERLRNIEGTDVYHVLIEKTLSDMVCINCLRIRGNKMSCFHTICKNCINNPCEVCKNLPNFEDFERSKKLICLKCFKNKDFEDFCSDQCMHLCRSCLGLEIEKQRELCRICRKAYKNVENIQNSQKKCEILKHGFTRLIEGFSLSCGHFFCEGCIRKISKKKRCLVETCKKTLLKSDFHALAYYNKVLCEVCNSFVSVLQIRKGNCCTWDVCVNCQGNSPFCIVCHSRVQ